MPLCYIYKVVSLAELVRFGFIEWAGLGVWLWLGARPWLRLLGNGQRLWLWLWVTSPDRLAHDLTHQHRDTP